MEFDLSRIRFSRKDLAKGIKIPIELTEELAEDIGIHVGDGCLYRHGENGTYEFSYSGNIAEKDYMHHIIKLKKKLYNTSKIRKYTYGNEFRVNFNSLAMATFYSTIIGLPIGKKKNIDVPNVIKNCKDKKIVAAFLRGLIDTDFCLVLRNKYGKIYPTIQGTFASKNLVISLKKLLLKLRIKSNTELNIRTYHNKVNKYYEGHRISICGYERINHVIKKIGFNNGKYKKKIMGLARFEFAG